MAAFAFMDIEKIKSAGTLTSKYIHNTRKTEIDNVIPGLSENNETLIALPKVGGKELNYNEALKDRLSTLDYYKNHGVRSNAVLGYEVLLTFSRDANIDLDLWKKQSVDWLHKTFDVASDGRSNVLHAEYHADETGNVHIHAFVVPIDERGRLNAKRFTDGSRAMSELQTTYAKSVADLGLKRGVAGSSARHQDIRRMYANLNNAMVLPEVKMGETAEEYKERISEYAKTAFAKGMRDVDDYAVRKRQEMDEQSNREREAINLELRKHAMVAEHELKQLEGKKQALEGSIVSYQDMVDMLLDEMADTKKELDELKLQRNKELDDENARVFYENIQLGMEVLRKNNPEDAAVMQYNIEYLQDMGIQRRNEIQMEENTPEFEDEESVDI